MNALEGYEFIRKYAFFLKNPLKIVKMTCF